MTALLLAAGALALLAAATLLRARRRERSAEARFPPEGTFVTVNGRKVHAVVAGEGPDLVLIHGMSGNTRDFTFALVPALARRFRLIAFDRPGLGWSDPLPRGAESLSDQARHLADAAAALGAERPLVLGHSYGGSVALAWAVTMPGRIAGLVTVSGPSHSWATPMPWLYRINSSCLGSALAVPVLTAWVPQGMIRRIISETFEPQPMPPGYDRHIGAALTLRRRSMRANALHRARLKADIEAMEPRYGALALPFELVQGLADETVWASVHAEPMGREAPTVAVRLLDGIGHMPHHIAMDEVIGAVDRVARRANLVR